MELRTKEIVTDLHTQVLDERLDRAEWNALLSQRLNKQELALLHDSVGAGKIALKQDNIIELARTTYPWMFNKYDAPNGETYPSWYERIKERDISRPKDLLHLSKLAFLAENYVNLDTFF